MSNVSHQATRTSPAADLLETLVAGAAGLLARLQDRRQQAYARDLFDGMDDAALKDVGIDRWTVCPARPVIEVKAGVMGRLMSMS
jgi:hypothetical protein